MDTSKYIAREVTRWINQNGDEIEAEIFQYKNHYKVVATICQEFPPYKDLIAYGKDQTKFGALFKAEMGLQMQDYYTDWDC
ncbi:hypothetical protein [Bacillus massilinigeriensis]|uniref:hypothetical protein n=1 Tax=Bacillus mediterraneensis TaxID=1805474 RepID=UPI0008F8FF09|nr:hypothetical protein [Bacillus mediterraneensis]